jgi:two-component system response regulator ResD
MDRAARVTKGVATAMAERARILIADGDALVRRFVGSLLTQGGYEVHQAEDAEAALDRAAALKPHLLILDLVLPGKDGFEVIQALRSTPGTDRLPILVLSVKDREEDVVKALDLGAEDYMIKPFSTRELMARVRKIIERSG